MPGSTAAPSKETAPSKDAKETVYKWGGKYLKTDEYITTLRGAKAKNSATWWKWFNVVLLKGVVRLQCTRCGEDVSAANPTTSATAHIEKHERAEAAVQQAVQGDAPNGGDAPGGADGAGDTPSIGSKRSRTDGTGGFGGLRTFCASAVQTAIFIKNLAMFFYTTNTALHLIENPYLVKAAAAVGIKLPGRKFRL